MIAESFLFNVCKNGVPIIWKKGLQVETMLPRPHRCRVKTIRLIPKIYRLHRDIDTAKIHHPGIFESTC